MKIFASSIAGCLMLALASAGICAGGPQPDAMSAVGEVKSGITGKVVETMTAAEYTYVLLEKDGEKAWAACPATSIAVGQELAFMGCTPMMDFQSKALNRTFSTIMFCGAPITKETAEMLARKSTGSNVAVPEIKEKIEAAKGANAYTIADIYARKGELDKKAVTVKGKVVKSANRILRRNWLHLQDGSGSAFQKNNDLVVTTSDSANVGDVVTVTGVIGRNKDFGSGYKYDLILEQATVQR